MKLKVIKRENLKCQSLRVWWPIPEQFFRATLFEPHVREGMGEASWKCWSEKDTNQSHERESAMHQERKNEVLPMHDLPLFSQPLGLQCHTNLTTGNTKKKRWVNTIYITQKAMVQTSWMLNLVLRAETSSRCFPWLLIREETVHFGFARANLEPSQLCSGKQCRRASPRDE